MNSTADMIEDALKLNSMPDPAGSQNSVPVHRTWEDALRHLCDHVLTSPECNAWAVVAPDYASILDPDDPDRRWEYAVRARESRGKTAQPLYDRYSEAVAGDALDARELCWHQSKGRVTVAVGTSGILMVIEDALRTAFLGGQGDPEATLMSKNQYGGSQPLARERGMRSGRLRSFARGGFRSHAAFHSEMELSRRPMGRVPPSAFGRKDAYRPPLRGGWGESHVAGRPAGFSGWGCRIDRFRCQGGVFIGGN